MPSFYFLPIFISPPSSARSSTSKELFALVCDPPNELHNITRDCRRYVHRARGVAVSDSLKSHLIAAPCVHCKRSRQNLAQLDYVAKLWTNEIRALLVTCFPHALLINMILRCSWRCSEMKFRRSATYVNQFPVKPVARHREQICSRHCDTSESTSLTRNHIPTVNHPVDSVSNIKIYAIVRNNRHFTVLRNGSEICPWQMFYFSYHFTSAGEKLASAYHEAK